jgi:F420-non-reducing hydrogenase iron-sulfur subunit
MNSHSGVYVYYCGNGEHGRQLPTALSEFEENNGALVEAVPCSGKIDPRYILKAFESGAEAVCVLACPSGHCKMMEGNLRAYRRIGLAREMLTEAGLNPDAAYIYMPASPEVDTLNRVVEAVARFIHKEQEQAQEALV